MYHQTSPKPHEKHFHISVKPGKTGPGGYDTTTDWSIQVRAARVRTQGVRTMNRGLLPTAMLLAAFTASDAGAAEYKGICEASAGAFIDSTHFVVASDETNKLQIYERGKPQPIGNGIDMETFTSFDKSDLEAAAVIGDRVYWISSHSFNSQGEDKSKRKVFFATKIVQADGKPTLVSVGKPVKSLRDPLAKAAGVKPQRNEY